MKQTVLEYISQGNTGQAIDALINGLSAEWKPGNAVLIRTARLIEAEYARLKDEQLANTIDPDAATARLNDINRRILDLLEVYQNPTKAGNKSSHLRKWAIVASGFLLLGILIFGKSIINWAGELFSNGSPPTLPESPYTCPSFDAEKRLKIAVLPLLNLKGSSQSLPLHIGLQDELNALLYRYKYPGQAEISSGNPEKNYLNFDEAEKLRVNCSADMVIWGKYTATDSGEPKIDIRFVSPAIAMSQQGDVDSLLEHRTQAELTSNLKTTALLLLAQAFLGEEEYELALRLANQAIGPPSQELLEEPPIQAEAHIIIAEAYQMLGKSDQAAESYKKALEIQPANEFALNNKVILDLKAKRFEEAQNQIVKAIEERPDSKKLEALRKKIASIPPGDPAISKDIIRDLRKLRQISMDSTMQR